MRLVWTEDLPAKPGWYWLRLPNSKDEVVRVWCASDGCTYIGWPSYEEPTCLDDEDFADAEWSGPIPEPSEPKQEEGGGGG